jgi:hypothetical protein
VTTEGAFFIRPSATGKEEPLYGPGTYELIKFHEDKGLADCAHYLSKCLQAAGLKGFMQRGVAGLVSALRARSDTKTLAEKVDKDKGQRVLDTGVFKPGDMIGYWHQDGKASRYGHSTMYVGGDRITCHTLSRFKEKYNDDHWFLTEDKDWLFTLIHFSTDDPAVGTGAQLVGWWEVTVGPDTSYYCFLSKGVVRSTKTTPKNLQADLSAASAKETGYWFDQGAHAALCWTKAGRVEHWDFGPSLPAQVKGTVDDTFALTAKRLT